MFSSNKSIKQITKRNSLKNREDKTSLFLCIYDFKALCI